MKSIIEQIYYSERGVDGTIPKSQRFAELDKLTDEKLEEYFKGMPFEKQKAFDDVYDYFLLQISEAEFTAYKEGVKVGLLLMAEAFNC